METLAPSSLSIDSELISWMFSQSESVIIDAKSKGSNPLLIKPKNFSTVINENKIENRVEFDTALDFAAVEELLVSEEIPVPQKNDYFYVTVVLFTKNKNVPLVFPYVFVKKTEKEIAEINFEGMNKDERRKLKKKIKKKKIQDNELKLWNLVNNKFEEKRLRIGDFTRIYFFIYFFIFFKKNVIFLSFHKLVFLS
jgi:hypothetical protein